MFENARLAKRIAGETAVYLIAVIAVIFGLIAVGKPAELPWHNCITLTLFLSLILTIVWLVIIANIYKIAKNDEKRYLSWRDITSILCPAR